MPVRRTLGTFAGLSWAAALLIGATADPAPAQPAPKATYVAPGSFQLPPKGFPGASERPAALAVGPDGLVHVADSRGFVVVLDSSGAYLRSYGPPRLDDPLAIALTREGESYVLDGGLKQVLVYAPDGRAARSIGGKGNRGGQLSDPVDLALGPGFVYVLDAGRRAVSIFSRDGTYVRDIALGAAILDPLSLAVGDDGTIYVADRRRPNQLFVFPPFIELSWVGPLPPGTAAPIAFRAGQLVEPVAAAVNGLATVVVLDKGTGRLWRSNAKHVLEIGADDMLYGGKGTGRGSFQEAVDIAFAGDRDLLILDRELRKVERIRLTTEEGLRRVPPLDFPVRVSQAAFRLPAPLLDVGYGADGAPLLLLETERRVVSLVGTDAELYPTAYGDSVRALLPNPSVLQRQFFQQISEVGAAILADTMVLVVDPRRDRFALYSVETAALLGTYGDNYRDERRLESPRGAALLPDGRVVIADTGNDRVKIFSADLASLVASYPVLRPAGVALAPDGGIYIWSEEGDVVGRLMLEEGLIEPLPEGLLAGPVAALAFDGAGNLFALDRATHRITIVETGLKRVLIQLGAEAAFDRPSRVVVDREGNIYVADDGARATFVFRWDVHFPPLADLQVELDEAAALFSWALGPERFLRGYEIQGAAAPEGPYSVLATADKPPYRLDAASVAATAPRYVRVAPVFITGVRGRATPPLPLPYFTALAAYSGGDYRAAQAEAAEAVNLIADGVLDATDAARGKVLRLGFNSAYRLDELSQALEWARRAVEIPMPRADLVEFLFRLADVYMRLGEPKQASQQILALVGQGPTAAYYEQAPVKNQSFNIYRRLRDTGQPEDALEFLRLYAQSMPETVSEALRNEYADSITVYATRARLGPGFEYWRRANYAQVVDFFERLLTQGGLSGEQKVISWQILAAAYYAFGRRAQAEDTFREIFNLRRNFDLGREIPRLARLYDLEIYNPETRRFFGSFGSRS